MKQAALIIAFLFSFVTLHAQVNYDTDQDKTNNGLINNIGNDATLFYKTSLVFVQSPFSLRQPGFFNNRDYYRSNRSIFFSR